jgi:hypothetical protein
VARLRFSSTSSTHGRASVGGLQRAQWRQERQLGHPEEWDDSMAGPLLGLGGLHRLGGPEAEWAGAKRNQGNGFGPKGCLGRINKGCKNISFKFSQGFEFKNQRFKYF